MLSLSRPFYCCCNYNCKPQFKIMLWGFYSTNIILVAYLFFIDQDDKNTNKINNKTICCSNGGSWPITPFS